MDVMDNPSLVQRQTVEVDAVTLMALVNAVRPLNILSINQLQSLETALSTQLPPNRDTLLGTIVSPKVGMNYLRSGDTAHDKVAVVSVEPFIVTTLDGKATWKEQSTENFVIIGRTSETLLKQLQNALTA